MVLVNADDPMLMELSSSMKKRTYGSSDTADTRGEMISSIPFLSMHWNGMQIQTQLYGNYNFENIMAAIALGELFEVNTHDIAAAITDYVPNNSRSQLIHSKTNHIYLDAYNANPSSMLASLSNFREQEGQNKVLILGDMLELGDSSLDEHQNIIREVKDKFDNVILVGPEFMKACTIENINCFPDTHSAASWLKEHPVTQAHILVKGSRGIALENLLDQL
jgi:UDP-N-acetylmuramoyl-tripeptide--D-alanyl-D-alanine ligase